MLNGSSVMLILQLCWLVLGSRSGGAGWSEGISLCCSAYQMKVFVKVARDIAGQYVLLECTEVS